MKRISVPYPSNFHWSVHVQRPFPWEHNSHHSRRPLLASYLGSIQAHNIFATLLRAELYSACMAHPKKCVYDGYSASHDLAGAKEEGVDPHRALSHRSTFCFQPIGDTPTRKGIFDTLMLGCIPVVFHPLSASALYTWHLPEEIWKQIVVEIPINIDRNYVEGKIIYKNTPIADLVDLASKNPKKILFSDPIGTLMALVSSNVSDVLRRQKLIRANAFRLQYALEDYVSGSSWPLDESGKPMMDAYGINMDLVLGMHSGRISGERKGSNEAVWAEQLPLLTCQCFNISNTLAYH